MSLTSFAKTVDALLQSNYGTTLAAFIDSRRQSGSSFTDIASDLSSLTGGIVDVTRTTIANWAQDVAA